MADLHAASSQWSTRPADQRFWTLRDMRIACENVRAGCMVKRVPFGALRAVGTSEDVDVMGPSGNVARLTHYSFGQLTGYVGAPAGYLQSLPASVAARCINAGIEKMADKGERDLLLHKNGCLTLRACLSNRYERVWDAELCAHLERLTGWLPPAGLTPRGIRDIESRPATPKDILPGQINITPGNSISPSGLYASDHDMFAFLVAPDRVISDGAGGSLMRGIFVRNSEVGDASLSVTFFLMQAVCGNHIVWGAQGVHEIRVRHAGAQPLRRALRGIEAELRAYHDAAPEEERTIIAARKMVLGRTKDEVLDAIVKYAKGHSLPISRKRVDEAYQIAEDRQEWYGNPRSLWGVVAGLTHGSQSSGFADNRAEVDAAAGKLLAMVKA